MKPSDYGSEPCQGHRGATCTCPFGHCNMEDPTHKRFCSASEMCNCFCPSDCRCVKCRAKGENGYAELALNRHRE